MLDIRFYGLLTHLLVSVAGCLGYDVLGTELGNTAKVIAFQLLVV